jgi:hypothetical protein
VAGFFSVHDHCGFGSDEELNCIKTRNSGQSSGFLSSGPLPDVASWRMLKSLRAAICCLAASLDIPTLIADKLSSAKLGWVRGVRSEGSGLFVIWGSAYTSFILKGVLAPGCGAFGSAVVVMR